MIPTDQYFQDHHKKDLIVLHFTAGSSVDGALQTWLGDPTRVATAFIVAQDGTVHDVFPPECWAYHLGLKTTHAHDKRSIGIEIVNLGPLTQKDGKLYSWTGKEYKGDSVESPYRGYSHYAAYPSTQIASVASLVKRLCDQFQIPNVIPPTEKRSEFDLNYFGSFQGVCAHQNFRKDKFDVGPAFDWNAMSKT